MNLITISPHSNLTSMVNDYAHDEGFAKIYTKVEQGQVSPPYSVDARKRHATWVASTPLRSLLGCVGAKHTLCARHHT